MVITKEQAEAMLLKEIAIFEDAIERLVNVSLTQGQFDCLVSFVYNVGIGAFSKSTLLKQLNNGKYDTVPGQLLRWCKATVNGKKVTLRGLVRRRKAEADLWLKSDNGIVSIETPILPQVIEPEHGEIKNVVKKSRTFWGAIAAVMATVGGYINDAFNFAGDVIVESQAKLTLTQTLYKMLSDNMKEMLVAIAVIGAIGVVWSRIRAEKEKKVA
jgi:hypothetical protein